MSNLAKVISTSQGSSTPFLSLESEDQRPSHSRAIEIFELYKKGVLTPQQSSEYAALLNSKVIAPDTALQDKLNEELLSRRLWNSEPCLEDIELLVALGADINCSNEQGATPLYLASLKPRRLAKIMEYFVSKDAAFKTQEDAAIGLLLWALDGHRFQYAGILLSKEVRVNGQSHYHHMPLLDAVYRGDKESVKWLISHGADPDQKSGRSVPPNDSAIDEAVSHHPELIDDLLVRGADLTQLSSSSSLHIWEHSTILREFKDQQALAISLLKLQKKEKIPPQYLCYLQGDPSRGIDIAATMQKFNQMSFEEASKFSLSIAPELPDFLAKLLKEKR